jgi:hypothetical protein
MKLAWAALQQMCASMGKVGAAGIEPATARL